MVISQEEVQLLIKTARDYGLDELVIKCLYYSGMRVGELAHLKWEDIDFDREVIHIKESKGAKDRIMFLHSEIKKDLLGYRGSFISKNVSGPVFVFEDGRPFSSALIQKIVQRNRQKAGFTKQVTPHTFRHAFAAHLLDGGASLWELKEAMGHNNIETTLKYTRISVRSFNRISTIL